MPEQHSASSQPDTCDAQWYVIHAGKELGPLPLAELVGKAALGEIETDDLVKKMGGLWTKARDYDFLHQQFLAKKSRNEPGPGAPNQQNQETERMVSPAAWGFSGAGTILFLLSHGDILFGKPPGGLLLFLATCLVWGLIFGIPACFCFFGKKRTGMTLVASLFFMAAGLDGAFAVYKGYAIQPRVDTAVPGKVRQISDKKLEAKTHSDIPAEVSQDDPYVNLTDKQLNAKLMTQPDVGNPQWTTADNPTPEIKQQRLNHFLATHAVAGRTWDEVKGNLDKHFPDELPSRHRQTYADLQKDLEQHQKSQAERQKPRRQK